MDGLLCQKRTRKLLEAHYNDAIPLDLLKKEQAQITKELAVISNEIKQHDLTFEQISQNLSESLDLLDDCAFFYRNASDTMKRLMNQAIFEKIYISYHRGETTMDLEPEFKPPFNILLEPFQEELTKINRALRQTADTATRHIQTAKNRILNTFRYGLAACDEHTHIESCPTPNFFTLESCNKALLDIASSCNSLCNSLSLLKFQAFACFFAFITRLHTCIFCSAARFSFRYIIIGYKDLTIIGYSF